MHPSMFDFKQFRDEWVTIKVEIYKTIIEDPYENTVTTSIKMNPVYFKAYVREVSPERLTWQLFGLKEKGAKELVTDKKNLTLLQEASKLYIGDDEFKVYSSAPGKRVQITTKGNYIVAILERI